MEKYLDKDQGLGSFCNKLGIYKEVANLSLMRWEEIIFVEQKLLQNRKSEIAGATGHYIRVMKH